MTFWDKTKKGAGEVYDGTKIGLGAYQVVTGLGKVSKAGGGHFGSAVDGIKDVAGGGSLIYEGVSNLIEKDQAPPPPKKKGWF